MERKQIVVLDNNYIGRLPEGDTVSPSTLTPPESGTKVLKSIDGAAPTWEDESASGGDTEAVAVLGGFSQVGSSGPEEGLCFFAPLDAWFASSDSTDSNAVYSTDDGSTWQTAASSVLGGQRVRGVATDGSILIAFGAGGRISVNSSGAADSGWGSWTTIGTTNEIRHMAHFAGLWVAVGSGGILYTSPDGVTWTSRSSGTSDGLLGVHYRDGTWIAVGLNSTFTRSTDGGLTWIDGTTAATNHQVGLTYGEGLWVSGDIDGNITVSEDDGLTWTLTQSFVGDHFRDFHYVSGFLFGSGTPGVLVTSENGQSWSEPPNLPSLGGYLYSLADNGEGLVMVVGEGRTLTASITQESVPVSAPTIPLGTVIWHPSNPGEGFSPANGALLSQAAYTDLFAAIGLLGRSSDLTSWNDNSIATTDNLGAVVYGSGKFVSTTFNGVYTSPDGINWTKSNTVSGNFSDILFANNLFLASGQLSNLWTSPDGVNWTQRSGTGNDSAQMAFGNGVFVLVGPIGTVWTSPDGINWTQRTVSGQSERGYGLAFGSGIFVMTGRNGEVRSSPDGINWTQRTGPNSVDDFVHAVFGGGLFATVGQNGAIWTSPDGANWTKQATPNTTSDLRGITHTGESFVAVGWEGAIWTSPDGVNWTAQTVPDSSAYVEAVAHGAGTVVAIGSDGIFWSSESTYPYDESSQFRLPDVPDQGDAKAWVKV